LSRASRVRSLGAIKSRALIRGGGQRPVASAVWRPKWEVAETAGRFRVILLQDPFTDERLRELGLNNRQLQLVGYIREHGSITNRNYRELSGLSDEAARKDIAQLRERGVLTAVGKRRSTAYVLKRGAGD